MKRSMTIFAIGLVATALIISDVTGRGGGGGGGGGRGGGGGGGGGSRSGGGGGSRPSAASASPSMSRTAAPSKAQPSAARPSTAGAAKPAAGAGGGQVAAARPATGGTGQGARPAQGGSQKFADGAGAGVAAAAGVAAGAGVAAAAGTRPAGANTAVADFLEGGSAPDRGSQVAAAGRTDGPAKGQSRVDNRAANRPAAKVAAVGKGQTRASLADGRGERSTPRQQELGQNADQVRNGLKEQYGGDLYNDFWGSNSNSRFEQNPVFWGWATFNVAQAFMPWNWGSEAYYDYGTGGNVYYEGDTVYTGETTVPAEQYADQAEQLATSVPKTENPDAEWLPLGVFALSQDGNNDAVPNMFLQLAVSKEGILAGTYQNKSTGQVESVEGMVDQKSQRAAFTVVGKNTPIVETGLANLTKNETRALVHFADGQTQQWLMLHVENPQVATKQ